MSNFILKDDLAGISTNWENLEVPDLFGPAKAYALSHQEKPFDYYVNRLLRLTSGGVRALDAGCGTGTWCLPLAQLFDEVIGIDQNRRRVDMAKWLMNKAGTKRIKIEYGDVRELEIEDESLDFVFCYGVIISYLSLKSVLKEFHRVLKPGGLVYICLNGKGWSYYLRDEYSKKSRNNRVIGMRSLYKNICHSHHSNINKQLSEFVARYSCDSQFKKLIANRLELNIEEIDSLIEKLLKPVDMEDITLPASIKGQGVPQLAGLIDRLLSTIYSEDQISLAETLDIIKTECDEEFVKVYGQDLLNLFSGLKSTFSYTTSGQEYNPTEVENIINEIGFNDFCWAGESELLGKNAIDCNCEPVFISKYSNELAVWEFLSTKNT